ncbi:MAG: RNA-binding transcriptional accessory protein [Paludibacteraceae bacterium]|nr:RNA-binding transcriptional accessory protein [Paludibacteraceae bacterium]
MISNLIAKILNIAEKQVSATLKLLAEGATVPFIARYRKEMTGSLDEVQIQQIQEQNDKFCELQKRKETILSTIEEQGKLTDELRKKIEDCWESSALEDLYLPYKPKKRTRAEVARQKGLEPLAKRLMMQIDTDNPDIIANRYVKDGVADTDEALKGAQDIIAEWVAESEGARNRLRNTFRRTATISSKVVKGKESEAEKYSDYFNFSEPLRRCSSHRLLAMRRGEAEGMLRVDISPEDDDDSLERIEQLFVKGRSATANLVSDAVADGYKRLLKPSIQTEFSSSSKESADEEAIRVFAENLRQLLLAAPLGQKRVLALDPGFRTGCKVVCLDAQGELKHHDVIFPHAPHSKTAEAAATIENLVKKFDIEAISIGNGTASRETEQFVRGLKFAKPVQVFTVSEDGASVYSASAVAREEFPKEDVTVRGAVSIGRRLIDPLAELVKIDPKAIGVGQYQHDVDQTKLKKSLDNTVVSCVNQVGVNVNTASKHLLTYISGLGPQLAQNIVNYRTENGPFTSRAQLKKVPRLGDKAFEQCAGFLRIPEAKNPLDNSAVHPESYAIVQQMAKDLNATVPELISNKELRQKVDLKKYVTATVGLPTLQDIIAELEKPGRDPREQLTEFRFDEGVHTVDDLREGMVLPGIVTNITNFGAFVDIGVHQDGLVHISQMADHYISNPTDVVSLHQHVEVKVIEIDHKRNRIALSLRK